MHRDGSWHVHMAFVVTVEEEVIAVEFVSAGEGEVCRLILVDILDAVGGAEFKVAVWTEVDEVGGISQFLAADLPLSVLVVVLKEKLYSRVEADRWMMGLLPEDLQPRIGRTRRCLVDILEGHAIWKEAMEGRGGASEDGLIVELLTRPIGWADAILGKGRR